MVREFLSIFSPGTGWRGRGLMVIHYAPYCAPASNPNRGYLGECAQWHFLDFFDGISGSKRLFCQTIGKVVFLNGEGDVFALDFALSIVASLPRDF